MMTLFLVTIHHTAYKTQYLYAQFLIERRSVILCSSHLTVYSFFRPVHDIEFTESPQI